MTLYDELSALDRRPEPFTVYTADVLWTEPHLAGQMLAFHLNQDTPLASRPIGSIDAVVDWIDETVGFEGKRVLDMGCGPGLYAARYAERGGKVTGLDFSANSIAYARENTRAVEYAVADYLKDPLPSGWDLVTLIYCDLCVLSPDQRARVLGKIRAALAPGGTFIFDVMALEAFEAVEENTAFGPRYMGGFWAAGDYVAFHHTFRYEAQHLSLDQYTIVEPHRTWQVFNWMQYFDASAIGAELEEGGFRIKEMITRGPLAEDGGHFAVIATPV
jgi:SAM-dependent methyltransferase